MEHLPGLVQRAPGTLVARGSDARAVVWKRRGADTASGLVRTACLESESGHAQAPCSSTLGMMQLRCSAAATTARGRRPSQRTEQARLPRVQRSHRPAAVASTTRNAAPARRGPALSAALALPRRRPCPVCAPCRAALSAHRQSDSRTRPRTPQPAHAAASVLLARSPRHHSWRIAGHRAGRQYAVTAASFRSGLHPPSASPWVPPLRPRERLHRAG